MDVLALLIFLYPVRPEKLGSKIKRIFDVLADHNQRIDYLTKRLENFKTFELSMVELRSIHLDLTNVQE